jgi:hypothetical protein
MDSPKAVTPEWGRSGHRNILYWRCAHYQSYATGRAMARKRHGFWNFLQLGLGGRQLPRLHHVGETDTVVRAIAEGLFSEWPHRQREITVRPASPKAAPLGSTISKSPSMRMGPLLTGQILIGMVGISAGPFDLPYYVTAFGAGWRTLDEHLLRREVPATSGGVPARSGSGGHP